MSSYVCWEWRRDDGGYSPYIPEVSSTLEADFSSGKNQHIVSLHGEVRNTLCTYVIDFTSMTQRRQGGTRSGMIKSVRRIPVDLSAAGWDIGAYWMWSDSPGHFLPYQVEASVDIEVAFQQKQAKPINLAKCPSCLPYTINLNYMNQTRHHYNTKRDIKRVALSPGSSLQSLLRVPPIAPVSTVATGTSSTLSGLGPSLAMPGTGGATALSHVYGPVLLPSSTTAATATRQRSRKSGGYSSGSSYPAGFESSVDGPHLVLPPTSSTAPFSSTYPSSSHAPSSAYHGPPSSNVPYQSAPFASHASSTYSSALPPSSHYHSTTTAAAFGILPNTTSVSSYSPPTAVKSKPKSRGRGKKASSAGAAPSSNTRGKSGAKSQRTASQDQAGGGGGGSHGDDILSKCAKKLKRLKAKDDEPCPICMNKASEPSGFEDEDEPAPSPATLNVYKLRKCGHLFHYSCLTKYIESSASNGGFQCPTCKKSYGVRTGDMPHGTMTVQRYGGSLPGHSDCGIIQITYSFTPGHHNGKRYRANGFPRTCYLPDSLQGQKVLKLLRVAWDRKLTFTIGTSVTTGATDTIVWNEIHHKTESTSNHSGHGYPDPHYLDRVLLELAAQGVEDGKEEEEDVGEESSESSADDDMDTGDRPEGSSSESL